MYKHILLLSIDKSTVYSLDYLQFFCCWYLSHDIWNKQIETELYSDKT